MSSATKRSNSNNFLTVADRENSIITLKVKDDDLLLITRDDNISSINKKDVDVLQSKNKIVRNHTNTYLNLKSLGNSKNVKLQGDRRKGTLFFKPK